jgi:hypothetical protein
MYEVGLCSSKPNTAQHEEHDELEREWSPRYSNGPPLHERLELGRELAGDHHDSPVTVNATNEFGKCALHAAFGIEDIVGNNRD